MNLITHANKYYFVKLNTNNQIDLMLSMPNFGTSFDRHIKNAVFSGNRVYIPLNRLAEHILFSTDNDAFYLASKSENIVSIVTKIVNELSIVRVKNYDLHCMKSFLTKQGKFEVNNIEDFKTVKITSMPIYGGSFIIDEQDLVMALTIVANSF